MDNMTHHAAALLAEEQRGTDEIPVRMHVNGLVHDLSLDPRVSLLDALREHLQLTGTKKGCNQGACGACTVLVDGERILSCLALAVQYDGRDVTTIEASPSTARSIRCRRRSSATTDFNAATARPGRSARRSACSRSSRTACRAPSRPMSRSTGARMDRSRRSKNA